MGKVTKAPFVQRAIIGPLASLGGVPHTAPQGATVHDAFPPLPPTKKKKKNDWAGYLEISRTEWEAEHCT